MAKRKQNRNLKIKVVNQQIVEDMKRGLVLRSKSWSKNQSTNERVSDKRNLQKEIEDL